MEERPHVVVVSGDEGVRAQLRLTLGQDRFHLIEAPDVDSASVAIADRLPELVVLDGELAADGASAFAVSLRATPETAEVRTLLLVPRATAGEAPGDATDAIDASIAMPATSFALLGRIEALLASG